MTADERLVPVGGINPYAAHPGFDAQDCPAQHVVTPAPYGSSASGFKCLQTGGHCLPGANCDSRRADYVRWLAQQSQRDATGKR